jgi:two-component system C4-dicarboxylate transport sensor histidine kinase DctB
MNSEFNQIYEQKRIRLYSGLIVFIVVVIVSISFSLSTMQRYFLLETAQVQSATLRLAVDSLRLTLDRYSRIPALIAGRPEISAFLDEPQSTLLRSQAETLLSETAEALGAQGVYLEDANGKLLASAKANNSSTQLQSPNFSRPYFNQVIAGGLGQYFALGTENGERGYFYAAPVRRENRINGVIAVRFTVNKFEANLRDANSEIIVRDSNDIVFISSKNEWNLKSFTALSDSKRHIIESAKQYPLKLIEYLPNSISPLHRNISLIELENDPSSFVASTSLLARAGWRVTILSPTSDAYLLTGFIAGGTILLALFASAVVLLIWQRQIRFAERLSEQRATKLSLERQVKTRTEELNQSNGKLIAEIDERKAAETQLRQTQNELIQAGKLAALGQMSAAISHEFNQPLAATKAYAENANKFIDRDRIPDAQNNVSQIVAMVDRMSSIAKHLRNFARRPQEKTIAVSVTSVIETVLELMNAQSSKQNAQILYQPIKEDLWVIGGNVRLQQVLLNLIKNALDATEEQSRPIIKIETRATKKKVEIAVYDNGPGITQSTLDQVFDPFFSTKSPGQGMGLGLSISYNIIKDFGGELTAYSVDEGGACFKIILVRTINPNKTEASL